MLSCDLCNHLFKIGTFIFSIFFLRVRNQRSGAITGLSSSRPRVELIGWHCCLYVLHSPSSAGEQPLRLERSL